MPPRRLTQEEKNRIKQEELERKAQEEEEERLKKEEELKEQQERDRVEREAREKELSEESGRFEVERGEFFEYVSKRQESYLSAKCKERASYEWERYTSCPLTPDPYSLSEINTFLNLWREKSPPNSFNILREEVLLAFQFIKELTTLQDRGLSPESTANTSPTVSFPSIMEEIYSIVSDKIDSTTIELMRSPKQFVDEVYGNLRTEVKLGDELVISLWGNVASNHRMSHVEFGEREMSIEAHQRGLQVPNVALRVTHTSRDLYSPRARSFLPRPIIPLLDEEPSQIDAGEDVQVDPSSKTSLDSTTKGSAVSVSNGDPPPPSKPQSASSQRDQIRNPSSQQASKVDLEKEGDESSAAEVREDLEVKQEMGEVVLFEIEEYEIDLRQFSPLGPITIMEYIRLPPQTRNAGGWQLQELEPNSIMHYPYPILQAGQDLSQITPGSRFWPYVSVSITIPEHLVLGDEIKVARWDEEVCQWRTDGFSEVKLEQDTRLLSFKSHSFSPIALMQDHYLNMPYQGWTIQPILPNSVKISITGNLHQFEIIVEDEKCRLIKPELPELTGLLDTPLLINRFITGLKSHGLNLFPASDAPNYVAISNKDLSIENDVYRDMSLLAANKFNFTWSSWNASCHGNQFIVRVCERQDGTLPGVEMWDLVLVGPKCYKLDMNELSEEFSTAKAQGSLTHSTLYDVLKADYTKQWSSEEDVDIGYTEAIYNLLMAIRPLVFT